MVSSRGQLLAARACARAFTRAGIRDCLVYQQKEPGSRAVLPWCRGTLGCWPRAPLRRCARTARRSGGRRVGEQTRWPHPSTRACPHSPPAPLSHHTNPHLGAAPCHRRARRSSSASASPPPRWSAGRRCSSMSSSWRAPRASAPSTRWAPLAAGPRGTTYADVAHTERSSQAKPVGRAARARPRGSCAPLRLRAPPLRARTPSRPPERRAAPAAPQGGFAPTMDRREASLILGLRESAGEEKIKDAHRRIMIANHPDSGEPVAGRRRPGMRILLAQSVCRERWMQPGGGGGSSGAMRQTPSHFCQRRRARPHACLPPRPAHASRPAPARPPGGSSFIAAKVNEAKDVLLGKKKKGGSVF